MQGRRPFPSPARMRGERSSPGRSRGAPGEDHEVPNEDQEAVVALTGAPASESKEPSP